MVRAGNSRGFSRWARSALVAAGCGMAVSAFAASAGSGQAYGLTAGVELLGQPLVTVAPLVPTGLQAALPDFDVTGPLLNINVPLSATVGVPGVLTTQLDLTLGTGVVTSKTKSTLAQNRVESSAETASLNLGLAQTITTLGVPATLNLLQASSGVITSKAKMTCENGIPKASGEATIAGLNLTALPLFGGPGLALVDVDIDATTTPDYEVANPLGLGLLRVTANQQTVTPNSITVNALRIELNVLGVVVADIAIGHSEASIDNCAPTVTLNQPPLPTAINAATDQTNVLVSGVCSAGSGDVTITSSPTPSVSQTLACVVDGNGDGSYSGVINTTAAPQGTLTITASQTASGDTDSDDKQVLKDTVAPAVTITSVTPSPVNAANQGAFTASGACTPGDGNVAVSISSSGGGAPINLMPVCTDIGGGNGTWTVGPLSVSGLNDGTLTVNASQTDAAQNTGAATPVTANKDTQGPAVTVTSPVAPITSGNQSGYIVTGSCESAPGNSQVTVTIGNLTYTVDCINGQWTVGPVNVGGLPGPGSVVITATQTDAAGNPGNGNAETTKATPPVRPAPAPVPVGGVWASLLLLAAGAGFLRRRRAG